MATAVEASGTYSLPLEFLDFRETIRKIVVERVAPRAAEIDAKAEYPHDLRELFAEHDLFGLPFDTEHGGTGTGTLMLNIAVEEVAKACASSALMLMIQELGTLPIKLFGTDEQKQRFLPECAPASGRRPSPSRSPTPAPTRAGCGTRAVRDGDEWVIDGTKNWITNLGRGRLLRRLLRHRPRGRALARDLGVRRRGGPAGLLGRQARAQDGHPRLAHRAADLRRGAGAGGEPDRRGEQGLQGGDGDARPLAARGRGAGGRDRPGRDRLRGRLRHGAPQFGKPIASFQGIQFKLADMETRTAAARELLYRACAKVDAASATSASTRRWRSCSPPTPRCG